jgi:phospholipid-translocating ATPase
MADEISNSNETTKHPRFASDNPFVPATETTNLSSDDLGKLHHRHVHENDNPNQNSPNSISFQTFEIDTHETEEVLDESLKRNKTVMKRHRWGTQRHKKGRVKSSVKRSKSIFNRSGSGSAASKLNNMDNDSLDHIDDQEPINSEPHKVYFNMHLPPDMIDDETGAPIKQYARNKIRTAKYSPLSFIPKNLYFQFQNVANIYFLFIVILGVCVIALIFFIAIKKIFFISFY